MVCISPFYLAVFGCVFTFLFRGGGGGGAGSLPLFVFLGALLGCLSFWTDYLIVETPVFVFVFFALGWGAPENQSKINQAICIPEAELGYQD